MTVRKEFFCNVCGDSLHDRCKGYGFLFKSGNTEFEHTNQLWQAENHLCEKCINAVHDMSVRIRNEFKRTT